MPGRQKKKDKSIIPVLFTLGIIGWGFFAIDRLTSPSLNNKDSVIIKDIPENKRTHHSRDNNYVKNFFQSVFSDVMEDDMISSSSKEIDKIEKREDNTTSTKEEVESSKEVLDEREETIKIYFYKLDKNGNPQLVWLKKNVSSENILLETFQINISPPDSRYSLVDSFPNRPQLLNAVKKGKNIGLYFNQNFIKGSSIEMIRYQLKQLLQTARQFKGIHGIQIFVNGKNLSSIGVDGLSIPEVITNI